MATMISWIRVRRRYKYLHAFLFVFLFVRCTEQFPIYFLRHSQRICEITHRRFASYILNLLAHLFQNKSVLSNLRTVFVKFLFAYQSSFKRQLYSATSIKMPGISRSLDWPSVVLWIIGRLISPPWWPTLWPLGLCRPTPWPPGTLKAYPWPPGTLNAYPLTPWDHDQNQGSTRGPF